MFSAFETNETREIQIRLQASKDPEKHGSRETREKKSFGSVWNYFYVSLKRKLKKLLWINKYEIERRKEL